jgi:hypothetical protein
MADTFTGNYNLTKPEIGQSRDTWGNKWNLNADTIDAKIKLAMDAAATAQATANTALTNAATAQSKADSAFFYRAQVGTIAIWSGQVAGIPSGWILCDGRAPVARSDTGALIGIPDLRGVFIYGAGGAISPGQTGGTTQHQHVLTVDNTSLSISQIPAHAHGVTDPGHVHTVNDPGHGHGVTDGGHAHGYTLRTMIYAGQQAAPGTGVQIPNTVSDTAQNTSSSGTGVSVQSGFTGLGVNNAGTGISVQNNGGGLGHNHTGLSDVRDHTPPYYALCYIMKV